jgi:hypothetical protein
MANEPLKEVEKARKRYEAETILAKLRQVDVPTWQGRPVAVAVRQA